MAQPCQSVRFQRRTACIHRRARNDTIAPGLLSLVERLIGPSKESLTGLIRRQLRHAHAYCDCSRYWLEPNGLQRLSDPFCAICCALEVGVRHQHDELFAAEPSYNVGPARLPTQ